MCYGSDTGYLNIMRSIERVMVATFILPDLASYEYCGKCGSDLWTIWIPGNGSKGCGNRYAVCQSSRDSDGSRLCHLPK